MFLFSWNLVSATNKKVITTLHLGIRTLFLRILRLHLRVLTFCFRHGIKNKIKKGLKSTSYCNFITTWTFLKIAS